MPNSEVAELIKVIRSNGFQVEQNGSSAKVMWKGEQVYKHEQDGGTPLTIHLTPSDKRWRNNMVPILIRAKVLDKDPFTSHTEKKKLTVTPEVSQSYVTNQLTPWFRRRLEEGFTQGQLAEAIFERWPEIAPTMNSVQVSISSILRGKQKGLTAKKLKTWKLIVEGWSKQPALPPKSRRKVSENPTAATERKSEKKLPEKPSIPLSTRVLAMMMETQPDRDEAVLLTVELLELEAHAYA